uniref:Uncharacterized protein n=1 Tax=Oryza brachyantha TaxID=4533 RepID=J3MWP2_ORYBR
MASWMAKQQGSSCPLDLFEMNTDFQPPIPGHRPKKEQKEQHQQDSLESNSREPPCQIAVPVRSQMITTGNCRHFIHGLAKTISLASAAWMFAQAHMSGLHEDF